MLSKTYGLDQSLCENLGDGLGGYRATVVTVDSLLDVFVGVVVVNFLVVVVWLLGQGVSGMEDL